jgi:MFS family permease
MNTVTMYFQDGLGLPAWLAGLAQMPFAIGSAVASARAGKLLPHVGRPLVVFGVGLLILGILAVALVAQSADPKAAPWIIAALLFIAGLGSGASISSNQTLTLETVPTAQSGTASGVLQTVQRLGASIGLALITTVFFSASDSGARGAGAAAGWGHALAVSLVLVVVLLGVALIVAVFDMSRRRR